MTSYDQRQKVLYHTLPISPEEHRGALDSPFNVAFVTLGHQHVHINSSQFGELFSVPASTSTVRTPLAAW